MKIIAFEKAWKTIWKIINLKLNKVITKHINLNWLVVENATTFFKSNQNLAKILENIEVKIPKVPKIKIKLKLYMYDKIMDKVTLATTIVDEWSKDDTGVGLSIAIGNHQLKIKRDDLPKIEKHNNKIILKDKNFKIKI
jgi:DNA-directed RNA polymerase subunit H (RpoH/RPB5)